MAGFAPRQAKLWQAVRKSAPPDFSGPGIAAPICNKNEVQNDKKSRKSIKCNVCGNIVEVVHAGDGELVCCGQPMKLMEAGVSDGALEKHVPVIEPLEEGLPHQVLAR